MVAHHHALARTGQAGHDAVAAPACWSPAAPSRPTVASALTACCTAGDSRASSGGSWPAAMKAAVAFSRPVTTSPIGALPPPAALAAACCTAGCSTARALIRHWAVVGRQLLRERLQLAQQGRVSLQFALRRCSHIARRFVGGVLRGGLRAAVLLDVEVRASGAAAALLLPEAPVLQQGERGTGRRSNQQAPDGVARGGGG